MRTCKSPEAGKLLQPGIRARKRGNSQVAWGKSVNMLAQTMDGLKQQIKRLIIEELDLRDKSEGDISDDAPLFGEGLGLDSLDALQLAMAVEDRFGVSVPEGDEARAIFASVTSLVEHIRLTTERASAATSESD